MKVFSYLVTRFLLFVRHAMYVLYILVFLLFNLKHIQSMLVMGKALYK